MEHISLRSTWLQKYINCPLSYYYDAILKIVPQEDADSLRVGTNWHGMHHAVGAETDQEKQSQLILDHLNTQYQTPPPSKSLEDWELERLTLYYAYQAYLWYYSESPVEVLATEVDFELPFYSPITGRALPNVMRRGRIDEIGLYKGLVYIVEKKSSSDSVDADSTYWDRLRLAIQPSMYLMVARELQASSQLKQYGIKATDPQIAGILFDVWHKPGISPKMLTQADTAEFLQTKTYCGVEFKPHYGIHGGIIQSPVTVDGAPTEYIPGKKEGTGAIRETPGMFGARFYQDMLERPEFYFARKEVPRGQADMERFHQQLFCLYKNIRSNAANNWWYGNPSYCEAKYKCAYCPICYHNQDVSQGPPPGFKIREQEEY